MKSLGLIFIIASIVAFVITFIPAIPIIPISPHLKIVVGSLSFLFGYILLRTAEPTRRLSSSSDVGTADLIIKFIGAQSIVISLIALVGAIWGFTSLNDIRTAKDQAQTALTEIQKMRSIGRGYIIREIEREISITLKEVPAVEVRYLPDAGKPIIDNMAKMQADLETLEKDIKEEERSKAIFLVRGFLKINKGDFPGAVLDLENATESPEQSYMLGTAYRRMRQYSNAEKEFKKQLKNAPKTRGDKLTARAQMGLAVNAALNGDLGQAEKLYLEALKSDENLSVIHYNLAALYSRAKKFDDAIREVAQAMAGNVIQNIGDLEKDPDGAFQNLIQNYGHEWKEILNRKVKEVGVK